MLNASVFVKWENLEVEKLSTLPKDVRPFVKFNDVGLCVEVEKHFMSSPLLSSICAKLSPFTKNGEVTVQKVRELGNDNRPSLFTKVWGAGQWKARENEKRLSCEPWNSFWESV